MIFRKRKVRGTCATPFPPGTERRHQERADSATSHPLSKENDARRLRKKTERARTKGSPRVPEQEKKNLLAAQRRAGIQIFTGQGYMWEPLFVRAPRGGVDTVGHAFCTAHPRGVQDHVHVILVSVTCVGKTWGPAGTHELTLESGCSANHLSLPKEEAWCDVAPFAGFASSCLGQHRMLKSSVVRFSTRKLDMQARCAPAAAAPPGDAFPPETVR